MRVGESVLAVLSSGAVVTLTYVGGVGSQRRWEDGMPVDPHDVVEAGSALAVYTERLALVTGCPMPASQWRESIKLALREAGSPDDPYAGRLRDKSIAQIADTWIEQLASGGRVMARDGGGHVVEWP